VQEDDLREICSLPAQFPTSGLSWVDLVHQSPLTEIQSRLTEDQLAEFLRSNQELIELWLRWSEDKRSTPSAFFRQSGARYEVGYIESDGGSQPSKFFDESASACAYFMLRELAV
jgi:hypothetical protein